MHFLSRTKFYLTGEFTGFIRNRNGKRRMLLRIEASEEISLKIPKELRKRFDSRLQPGALIAVLGIEYRDFAGESKYVVSHLRVLSPGPGARDACGTCPIRVCAKKNCWKNGGKQFFEQLQARVAKHGLQDVVKVKAVGCLDNCKRGANAICGKETYERCNAESVDEIIERVKEHVDR
jgi:Thioredoxin-like [2Fe-2S] ferredoxin